MIETGGVKLYKFEIRDGGPRPVRHCNPVPRRDIGIRCIEIYLAGPAGGENGMPSEKRDCLATAPVEDIASPHRAPLILNKINREMILPQLDILVSLDLVYQCILYRATRNIIVMNYARSGMSPLTPENVGTALCIPVEADTESRQLFEPIGTFPDHDLDRLAVAETLPGGEGVRHVELEGVVPPHHGRDTSLRIVCVALEGPLFRQHHRLSESGGIERKEEPGGAASQNEYIAFVRLQLLPPRFTFIIGNDRYYRNIKKCNVQSRRDKILPQPGSQAYLLIKYYIMRFWAL